MMKVPHRLLLVTTRNLSESVGAGRLITNRAAALQSDHGVITDVLYLRAGASMPSPGSAASPFGNISVIPVLNRVTFRNVAALLDIRKCIAQWMMTNPHGFVVISGAQLYLLPLGIPKERTLIDLHGTLREWVEGAGTSQRDRILRFMFPVAAMAERAALADAAGALVVSAELEKYARACGAKKTWKVPCGLLRNSVGSESVPRREEWRTRLSIPRTSTAFVYSGGLAKWQCIREAVLLFQRLQPVWPGDCKLVIMTPRAEALGEAISELDTKAITVCSVFPSDIGNALSACDIGLMLREDSSTNHNAFPNKFAEYVAASLFIITSPGLTDPADFVLRHRLGVLIDPHEVREGLSEERVRTLIEAYGCNESRSLFLVRARRVVEELTMEVLVAPFARSVTGHE